MRSARPTRLAVRLRDRTPAVVGSLLAKRGEGAEMDVIRGSAGFLLAAHPKLIVEFADDEAVAKTRALLPGYRFEHLGASRWLLT